MDHPTITLEEHFFSRTLSSPDKLAPLLNNFPPHITEKLLEVGDKRIESMDAGGVSLQVISHGPNASSQPPSDITAANNELHAHTTRHPGRFAAFAALAMAHPEAAVQELHRCITSLGFVGALVDNHLTDGRYYEGKTFWPVFEAAQALDVAIYIHPTTPVDAVQRALYDGPWQQGTAFALGTSAWGWHADVGLHILRLHAGGVFDAFPRLKVVIGHMGEMLPFMLDRIVGRSKAWTDGLRRGFLEVWNENIWVTTASFFSLDPMACLLRNTRRDRIMYSVDYPFSDNLMGKEFLEKLRGSGMVSEEVFEGIAYRNAENLLRVKATSGT